MATVATPGKTSAVPAISAALFQKDCFYVRRSRFSLAPKLYFYDEHGQALAFVRSASFAWNKEVRIFTDPTLSFELLALKPAWNPDGSHQFTVTDSVNHQPVGAIKQLPAGRLQRRGWSLLDCMDDEIAVIKENSLFRAGMRRLATNLIPQTYTFFCAEHPIGSVAPRNNFFSPEVKIDLARDCEKQLDRRLVAAAVVLLMVPSAHQLQPE